MLIYATFDEDGQPTGFYPEDIFPHDFDPVTGEIRALNDKIPAGATLLSSEQWQEFIDHSGHRRWDGSGVVPYEPPPPPPPVILKVSAAQALTALYNAEPGGALLDRAEEMARNHPYRPVRIFFEKANFWEKANPYLQGFAVELGLITYDASGNEDASKLDALFVEASKV